MIGYGLQPVSNVQPYCSEGLDMPGVSDLHQREVTRDHGPIRALVSFASNRNLSANMHRARLFGYSLAYSG